MKTTGYILKRIAISVGIIIVLSIIRSFLVINTYAKETIRDDFTKPVYHIPQNTTLNGSIYEDKFISNYGITGYTLNGYWTVASSNPFIPTLNETYPYMTSDITNSNYYRAKDKTYESNLNSLSSLTSITFTTTGNEDKYLKANTEYSILIRIEKEQDMEYYDKDTLNNSENINLDYFRLLAYQNSTQVDLTNDITIQDYELVKGINRAYNNGENERYTNNSYIYINYKTSENLEENTYNIRTQTISFDINKAYTGQDNDYLYKYDNYIIRNNNPSSENYQFSIALIEGKIEFVGRVINGMFSSGIEYDGELDIITEEDRNIFDNYETCEPLDIACHVRNIITALKNIFVRIGNAVTGFFRNITKAIQELFIPNFNDLQTTYTELKETFINKLGFIGESEEYFEILLRKFQDLDEGNVIIHIPEIEVPNFNRPIIHEQDWNLSSYFSSGTLKAFYDLYKTLISGVFIFLLIEHARHRLGALINMYDTYENGTVREGVRME